jgi:DNA (cytosine-5)-methyltransferase 1
MGKPRILDLFCGAGGSATGLHRAGFEVVGVDIKPQPRYPFEFHMADAITFPLDGYDAYWASPPCQGYMNASHIPVVGTRHKSAERLIEVIRERLLSTGKPFIIENVPGAPLKNFVQLSGPMFNLKVIRKRWFECHDFEPGLLPPPQTYKNARAAGYIPYNKGETTQRNINLRQIWYKPSVSIAMGIDWMQMLELNQAIPPAYSEFLGKSLMRVMEVTNGES